MSQTVPSSASAIPSVDRLLRVEAASRLLNAYGRAAVLDSIRTVLASLRRQMADDDAPDISEAAILDRTAKVLVALMAPSLKPVFNLTGTVLHTNLGRAPLPDEASLASCSGETSSDSSFYGALSSFSSAFCPG